MSQKGKLFSTQFIVLFLAIFSAGYCLYCLNSTVSLYVNTIGGVASTSGILNTCFTISACIARIVGGNCADRFGRKRIIIIGGIILGLGTAAYSITVSFPALMVLRCIQGIGYAVMSVGASTALIDVLPKDRLGEGIGVSAIASTLAGSIAPSIGVAVAVKYDFKAVFISTSAVAVAGVISTLLFCNYENKEQIALNDKPTLFKKSGKISIFRLIDRQALTPASVYMMFTVGFSITHVFMTLFATQSGIINPGSYFIASSVCQVLARIIAGRFADRDNAVPVVVVGGLFAVTSYAVLAFSCNAVWYLLSGAMFGIGNGIIGPVLNRLAVMNAIPERRGAASATYSISADLGNGIGGLIWGTMIDHVEYNICFGVVSAWMIVALTVCIVYLINRNKKRLI